MIKYCTYCKKVLALANEEYYIIRRAKLPPRYPHRYVNIGYCCEDCEAAGKLTKFDPWKTS